MSHSHTHAQSARWWEDPSSPSNEALEAELSATHILFHELFVHMNGLYQVMKSSGVGTGGNSQRGNHLQVASATRSAPIAVASGGSASPSNSRNNRASGASSPAPPPAVASSTSIIRSSTVLNDASTMPFQSSFAAAGPAPNTSVYRGAQSYVSFGPDGRPREPSLAQGRLSLGGGAGASGRPSARGGGGGGRHYFLVLPADDAVRPFAVMKRVEASLSPPAYTTAASATGSIRLIGSAAAQVALAGKSLSGASSQPRAAAARAPSTAAPSPDRVSTVEDGGCGGDDDDNGDGDSLSRTSPVHDRQHPGCHGRSFLHDPAPTVSEYPIAATHRIRHNIVRCHIFQAEGAAADAAIEAFASVAPAGGVAPMLRDDAFDDGKAIGDDLRVPLTGLNGIDATLQLGLRQNAVDDRIHLGVSPGGTDDRPSSPAGDGSAAATLPSASGAALKRPSLRERTSSLAKRLFSRDSQAALDAMVGPDGECVRRSRGGSPNSSPRAGSSTINLGAAIAIQNNDGAATVPGNIALALAGSLRITHSLALGNLTVLFCDSAVVNAGQPSCGGDGSGVPNSSFPRHSSLSPGGLLAPPGDSASLGGHEAGGHARVPGNGSFSQVTARVISGGACQLWWMQIPNSLVVGALPPPPVDAADGVTPLNMVALVAPPLPLPSASSGNACDDHDEESAKQLQQRCVLAQYSLVPLEPEITALARKDENRLTAILVAFLEARDRGDDGDGDGDSLEADSRRRPRGGNSAAGHSVVDDLMTTLDTEVLMYNTGYIIIRGFERFVVSKIDSIVDAAVDAFTSGNGGRLDGAADGATSQRSRGSMAITEDEEEQVVAALHIRVTAGIAAKLNEHWAGLHAAEDFAFFHACTSLRRDVRRTYTDFVPLSCAAALPVDALSDCVRVCKAIDAPDCSIFAALRIMDAVITRIAALVDAASANKEDVTADVCIPLVVIVLILTALQNLPSRIKMILEFIVPVLEMSSLGYALTTFEASAEQIQYEYAMQVKNR